MKGYICLRINLSKRVLTNEKCLFDVVDVTIKVSCLCFSLGIVFSTLVFGPACGFILGSLCTKVYVDAVFIDTSQYLLPSSMSRVGVNST